MGEYSNSHLGDINTSTEEMNTDITTISPRSIPIGCGIIRRSQPLGVDCAVTADDYQMGRNTGQTSFNLQHLNEEYPLKYSPSGTARTHFGGYDNNH